MKSTPPSLKCVQETCSFVRRLLLPEHGEDVSRAGRVLAAMQPGSKLTQRLQQVQVVTSHKVLSQTHNSHHQRDLKNDKS